MTNDIRIQSIGALPVIAIVLFILLIIVLIPLAFLGLVGAAFTRLGFSWLSALAVILLILLGSGVNIPVCSLKREMVRMEHGQVSMSDPFTPWKDNHVWETTVSVSLGGAIIPVCLVVYVIVMAYPIIGGSLTLPFLLGIAGVALITYASTRAVPDTGLQVPMLIPSLAALLIGLVFAGSPGVLASVTAMTSGIVGVLLGGNLFQLGKIRDLGIPSVSIGGSGTFGAVLFCCVLPALIA